VPEPFVRFDQLRRRFQFARMIKDVIIYSDTTGLSEVLIQPSCSISPEARFRPTLRIADHTGIGLIALDPRV
jgi:hypothetical protein